MKRKTLYITVLLICISVVCYSQQSLNVLFIGNSYTEVNNLPLMIKDIALSMGDELNYQSNTPGGCTFSQHCYNHSMEMIRNGGWDIVVLQEQSQYPSFPQEQVEMEVFPYAQRLVDSIYMHSPCCEPMFYMTWGRKNGDATNAQYFPVLGTYEGMDSMLCERYTYMAEEYDASLCPVGRVWRYLRENNGDIELYQSDESHPSVAGSYAAACAFYVLFFHKDPNLITYSASLQPATAQSIRQAVHSVVYENLSQWQRKSPQASFSFETPNDNTVLFSSTSQYADSLIWDFGDGGTSLNLSEENTIEHTFATAGDFSVTLIAQRHCMSDTSTTDIFIPDNSSANAINTEDECGISFYPNPAKDVLQINIPKNIKPVTIVLLSMDGKILSQTTPQNNETILFNLGNIDSGDYILQINAEDNSFTFKVAVLR